MKPKLLLRIASLMMLLHLIGHSFGNELWKKTDDPTKMQVIHAMTYYKFPFMGSVRSFGDNFSGYGYAVSLFLILSSVLLWLISSSLKEKTTLSIKILLTLFICLTILGIDELIFFFPFAASLSLISAILTGLATILMRNLNS